VRSTRRLWALPDVRSTDTRRCRSAKGQLNRTIHRHRGEYTKAEGNFFRAVTAFSKQGNRAGLCSVLLQLTEIHRLNGNLQEARSLVEEASRYAVDLGIANLAAQCNLERARLLRLQANPDCAGAIQKLEEALQLVSKGDNPELPGEINFQIAETLVDQHEVTRATQYYKSAEEKFREVLENLPEEFRATYDERWRTRFQGRAGAAAGSAPEGATPARPPEAPAPSALKPAPGGLRSVEECLRRVNQLMAFLQSASSLPQFFGGVLDEIIKAAGAELGLILSLSGRNLTVIAARDASGNRPAQPGKLLCLRWIDRSLRQQQPALLEDVADEPEALKDLEGSGVACQSLAILPFLEPAGKKGAVYLINPTILRGAGSSRFLLIQPFLSLIPMGYLRFASARVALMESSQH
jgi:tetratricopeptide (TPR) repeat protein